MDTQAILIHVVTSPLLFRQDGHPRGRRSASARKPRARNPTRREGCGPPATHRVTRARHPYLRSLGVLGGQVRMTTHHVCRCYDHVMRSQVWKRFPTPLCFAHVRAHTHAQARTHTHAHAQNVDGVRHHLLCEAFPAPGGELLGWGTPPSCLTSGSCCGGRAELPCQLSAGPPGRLAVIGQTQTARTALGADERFSQRTPRGKPKWSSSASAGVRGTPTCSASFSPFSTSTHTHTHTSTTTTTITTLLPHKKGKQTLQEEETENEREIRRFGKQQNVVYLCWLYAPKFVKCYKVLYDLKGFS